MGRAVQELGGLDIVVNNAAGNFFCPSADLSPNGFGTVIDIDAKGTWNVSRAAYQARLKDHGGQILNISATLHYGGTPGQVHVAAAKAAVDAMTRTLAVEWGPQGIRVNAIAPGPIGDTEGARRLFPGAAAEAIRAATRPVGSARSTTSSTSPCSCSATPGPTSMAPSSSPTAASAWPAVSISGSCRPPRPANPKSSPQGPSAA